MIKLTITDDRKVHGRKKFRRSISISVDALKERRGIIKFVQNKVFPFLYNALGELR